MDFLNLDEVSEPKRTVKISGVEYVVLGMTVGNFIETVKASKALKDADEQTKFEEAIKMLSRAIPDLPEDELRRFSFQKLNILLDFVNGKIEEQVAKEGTEPEGTEPEGTEPEGGAKPKKQK